MGVPWIKLEVNMFGNAKIKVMLSKPNGHKLFFGWVRLLAMAGEINEGGAIWIAEGVPHTVESLAETMPLDVDVTVTLLDTLRNFKMIVTDDDGVIYIKNWAEYQNVEGMDKIREQGKERQRAYRERQKAKKLEAQKQAALEQNGKTGKEPAAEVSEESKVEKDSNVTVTSRNAQEENRQDKTRKESKTYSAPIVAVFEFWNEIAPPNAGVKHKELTMRIAKEIKGAIKKGSEEEIKEAISLLAKAVNDESFYYDNKWTLPKFMKQANGFQEWIGEGGMKALYESRKEKPAAVPQGKPQGKVNSFHNFDGKISGKDPKEIQNTYHENHRKAKEAGCATYTAYKQEKSRIREKISVSGIDSLTVQELKVYKVMKKEGVEQ